MAGKANFIPQGARSVTPYLIVDDAEGALAFYQKAFGATEKMRFEHQGKIGHAEIVIGDSSIMLADEYPDMDIRGPRTIGGTPVSIMLYVPDVDATVAKAVEAGADVQRPIEDKFYGDRGGSIIDPYGHIWHVATHVEDVPEDEMHRRLAAMDKRSEKK
ncbi:MAG TPA: VOC family protein [Alphaproteobacteria bacterium]|jgi:PhnB protein